MNEAEALKQAEQEELIGMFNVWLDKSVQPAGRQYVQTLLDNLPDETLLHLAEVWYMDTYGKQFYYGNSE